ncbi:ABC transporter permease [Diplocloster agilis]|uniref:ABC transporter permease n=1 Tax=Diplocloster agilis TaxID=2850323 RepID=A0A949K741_9FIRM|nr:MULTISPECIES: ABC transporter permease [Lachnospiraceae]MBU9737578.1 ABC transporter permease [Diplocloster agilis]MBU9744793.1 ABC transporter permease [Diplocloster agilis]MCU6735567.1 ABC transporter permease [Suonthocola fibrivorans]SCJ77033.1 Ribose transport system permease protein rbsC [uncultured Clostridium sp.]
MRGQIKFKSPNLLRKYSILIIIAGLIVFFSLMEHRFISAANITNIIRQSAVMIIVASGATFVMIAGDIDISIGGVACMTSVIAGLLIVKGFPIAVAVLVAVFFGGVCGIISGALIARFDFPSMVATLAMMNLTTGIANLLTDGTAISNLPASFQVMGRGYLGPVPIQVLAMLVIVVVASLVLTGTTYGRYIYAIGGNANVAKLSGINVKKMKLVYYMISGFCAAFGGILITSRMGSAQPTLGVSWPMDILSAIVIGGVSFKGGSGTILNAVFGIILMTLLTNGLTLLGINTFWQAVVTAILLMVTIIVNYLQDSRKKRD